MYTTEYYLAIKRNEELIQAKTEMNDINIMQKDTLINDSIYMKWPELTNLQRNKVDEWLSGAEGDRRTGR